MSGDIFGCHAWGGSTGTQWVETGDAAQHPTVAPTADRDPAPSVTSAEAEKTPSKAVSICLPGKLVRYAEPRAPAQI